MSSDRRRFMHQVAAAGSLAMAPALGRANEATFPGDYGARPAPAPLPVAVAPDPDGFPVLDLAYAGYLISGVGATPLASARLVSSLRADQYEIELRVESFLADLTYRSRGVIDETGLKPLEYQEKRKVAFRREREKSALYVHTDDPAIQNTQSGRQLFVPPGAQDRLSLILQIIWLSRQNSDVLINDNEVLMPFARVNRVSDSRWHIRGPEPLQRRESDQPGALSSQRGFKVTRVADNKDTVDVVFWLSAVQPRRPLVLQFSEKGRSLRFVHESV